MEKIGNIILNYDFYSGDDFYSEGDIEDRLLEIVINNKPNEYNKIIADKKNWAIMYHLSHIRKNILGTVPISKNDSVLEIGSGCGAITGELAKKSKKVTCIELSKRRSLINAYQNKEYDNIEIIVGNFQTIEEQLQNKYDIITLIGVFEYAQLYIDSKQPFDEFLCCIKKHLKPNGRIIIAIENKFGLKYWAGYQEDHVGGYFTSIEGYVGSKDDGVYTFSKNELEDLFKKCSLKYEFYYPYPDYKFPNVIYSDDYLPNEGELINNFQNFDRDRLLLFNEGNVYNQIIRSNMFPFFSNSFLIILNEEGERCE